MAGAPLLAGIEVGGSKVVCVLGRDPDDIVADTRIPTTDPAETLGAVGDFFAAQATAGNRPAAAGIASFGPVELRRGHPHYGHITITPKPDWSNTNVAGPIGDSLGVPVWFDTDVNGAALGEGRWGAAVGLDSHVYVTVGTGIGGGAVVRGSVVHGLVHAEMGHVAVPRYHGDDYAGRCPFHVDCLEGMASGPAIEERWRAPASDLEGKALRNAVDTEAHYLAFGLRNIVYTLAPERIVIGGGVAALPGLFPAIRRHLGQALAGYPGLSEHASADFVVPAGLGAMAGPAGALAMAERALAEAG